MPHVDTPRAVMWSISDVARRDGISKQAVSKKVRAFVAAHGLTVERGENGRIRAINVAEYDHLRGRFGDPSKVRSRPPSQAMDESPAARESYEEALRQKTWHDAERARIAVDELKGRLVRVEPLTEALRLVAAEIAALIDRLPNVADELAAAVGRDGAHGARLVLKRIAKEQRSAIAEAMAGIHATAPAVETDDNVGPVRRLVAAE